MISIECAFCESELALETMAVDDVTCRDCGVTVGLAPDPEPVALPLAA